MAPPFTFLPSGDFALGLDQPMETFMTQFLSPTLSRLFLIAVIVLLSGVPLLAIDGVLEINQTCVATGCFPGDAPGFPVETTQSGSYRLTSNLNVPNEDTTGILVGASDTTIDLNGFGIFGVTVCSGQPIVCAPAGNGHGINRTSGTTRLSVRNGVIRGMGGIGLLLGSDSMVEEVQLYSNGSSGIQVTFSSTVRNSLIVGNGHSGISASRASSITGCIVRGNGDTGINCGATGCSVRDSLVYENEGRGISLADNGLALNNTINNNSSTGLSAPPGNGYAGNVLSGNADGSAGAQIGGGGLPIGENLCAGVPCP